MSSAGVSLVKTLAQPGKARGFPKEHEADCGIKWQGLLVRSDQDLFSSKIVLCSESEDSTKFCEALPKWGMMQDGELYPLKTPELFIRDKGFGFLPTPVRSDYKKVTRNFQYFQRRFKKAWDLNVVLVMIGLQAARTGLFGRYNAETSEVMMGWPIGWTELKQSATAKFQLWRQQHGESLEENK